MARQITLHWMHLEHQRTKPRRLLTFAHCSYLGCVAEMVLDNRKIKCATHLGALDAPRSSMHKAEKIVGFVNGLNPGVSVVGIV